ncbi:MAG: MATE family efflux transporter [Lachnospiraceae bacterium]|nr:MATE family efflux transporter [Lachnospiraceae bacterium]
MSEQNLPKIDNKKFYNRLFTIALPIGFQSLMLALVAAADALMLGKIAQEEMTAVSLATQIQFVQNMFLASVTAACGILGAQYYGKKDIVTLKKLFGITLFFSIIISLIFFISCEFYPEQLMHIFTHDERLIAIGSMYLKIAGWSYLITGISQCYLTVMKLSEHVMATAVISTGAVIINIIFNAFLIFGIPPFSRMESKGAALATTLARIIELVFCLGLSLQKNYVRPAFKNIFKNNKILVLDFFKQVVPLLGGSLFWGVGFTSYTAIIGHMDSNAAAANSVASVIRDLICCACNGVGSAAGIMIGYELGAGKLEEGKAYGIKLKNISWVIGFASTALVFVLTPFVVNMVLLTDEARKLLTGMMIIMGIYMIGRAVNTITINGVLDGGGDTMFDMYSLAVCMWCIAIPLAFLGAFVFHWHPWAVYACTCLDEVGKIPWVMIRFRKYKWVRNLTRQNI